MTKYLNFYEFPVWIKDQMLRALLSIMNNISEGFDCGRKKEQVWFYEYAKRSSSEVESMLFVMLDTKMISNELFEKYQNEIVDIRKQLSGLINYSKNR